MSETTLIIVRWLLHFHPSAWLAWVIRYLMTWRIGVLEDEEHRAWLDLRRSHAAKFGGWIVMIETRLEEWITLQAMKRLGRRFAGQRLLKHRPAPGVRCAADALNRLTRLIVRYHDAERLVALKAAKLRRLFAQAELQLEITHHPIHLQPASAGGAGVFGIAGTGVAGVFEIPDSGVRPQPDARIRAPPRLDRSPKISPIQPAALTCETETACPTQTDCLLPIPHSLFPGAQRLKTP